MLYPLKTEPVFKQYIWGGSALNKKFGKNIEDNFAAESWELSCHDDGPCLVANGKFKGRLLKDVIYENEKEMLGDYKYEQFPLLVKFLDANSDLSVQVHPDDDFAKINENGTLGKTEMWYVIDARPGAKLIYGLKDNTTRASYKAAIENGTLEELLNYVDVKKGDTFFIPAKTLHAICSGLLIAEIQQSSNTTYRVYDYNRTDADGNKRPLHIEKAIAVTNLDNVSGHEKNEGIKIKSGDAYITYLAACEFFAALKYDVSGSTKIPTEKRFEMLICTEGAGKIVYNCGQVDFKAGDSMYIPALMGDYSIEGNCEALRCFVPDLQTDIFEKLKDYSKEEIKNKLGMRI